MKYYQVSYADKYDGRFSGVIPGFFTSKEEASKCADWHDKHPMDINDNCVYFVNEIDMDNIITEFVPPMTEEEYQREWDSYFFSDPEEPMY